MTTESLKKSEAMCLKALNEMCDVLAKALPRDPSALMAGIKASPDVPDYTPEQVVQARGGSEAPINRTAEDDMPQGGAQDLPSIDPNTARDLSMFTPEHLHSIVQHASENIAKALMESIKQHNVNLDPGKVGSPDIHKRMTTGKLVSSIRQPPRQ